MNSIVKITLKFLLFSLIFQSVITIPIEEEERADYSECGLSSTMPKIINGDNAVPNSYPWHVFLALHVGGGRYSFCGGSIISPIHILTAAHCVAGSVVDGSRVLYEIHKFPSPIIGSGDPYRLVRTWKMHEQYNHQQFTKGFDVAIITLESPIIFSANARPVCLPPPVTPVSGIDGARVMIIGLGTNGYSSSNANTFPATLQQAEMTIVNTNGQCTTGQNTSGNRVNCVLAVKGTGTNACNGDSGGSLLMNKNNRWYTHGVLSYGYNVGGKCATSYPAFYTATSINEIYEWINRQTGVAYFPGN